MNIDPKPRPIKVVEHAVDCPITMAEQGGWMGAKPPRCTCGLIEYVSPTKLPKWKDHE